MKNDPTYRSVNAASLERNHEAQEPDLRMVRITVMSVMLLILFCLLTATAVMWWLDRKRPMQHMEQLGILIAPDQKPLTRFPSPNLQLDDGHAASMAWQQLQFIKLESYGWIDRSNGIVHVPIGRAMDLILSRGFPVSTNDGLPFAK